MICPLCAAQVGDGESACPACQTGLAEYRQVYYQADILYNDALTRLRRGRFSEAANLLCRAAGLRPDDVEIRLLWARALREDGCNGLAARVLLDAMELDKRRDVPELYKQAMCAHERDVSSPDALLKATIAEAAARADQSAARLEAAVERLESLAAQPPQHPPEEKSENEPL